MQNLKWVKLFATNAHEGQRYGPLPYTHHLQDVYETLLNFEIEDEDILIAAWLHDTIEDTADKPHPVKRKHIHDMFGERVAALVWAVTDEGNGPRREVKARTYEKIKVVPGAVALKLADRIANVSAGGSLIKMYKKEHEDRKVTVDGITTIVPGFKSLYVPGEYEDMWAWLEIEFSNEGREPRTEMFE